MEPTEARAARYDELDVEADRPSAIHHAIACLAMANDNLEKTLTQFRDRVGTLVRESEPAMRDVAATLQELRPEPSPLATEIYAQVDRIENQIGVVNRFMSRIDL